jgi:hypothetical protein
MSRVVRIGTVGELGREFGPDRAQALERGQVRNGPRRLTARCAVLPPALAADRLERPVNPLRCPRVRVEVPSGPSKRVGIPR